MKPVWAANGSSEKDTDRIVSGKVLTENEKKVGQHFDLKS